MSSLAPTSTQVDKDLHVPRLGRSIYPGGPRRIPSVSSLDAMARVGRDVLGESSWTLGPFSGRPLERSHGGECRISDHTVAGPSKSLASSPKRAAFEEWLVKACLEASRSRLTELNASVVPIQPQDRAKPAPQADKTPGELEALILKACLEDVGSQIPKAAELWPGAVAPRDATNPLARKASPQSSVSDVSMDTFAMNSSDYSDAYSTAGSSAGPTSEPNSSPGTARVADLPPITSQAALTEGTPPVCIASAPEEGQCCAPLKKTRPEHKGGFTFSSIASALVYPWVAASAAASTALETLGSALAIFEDEEWGDRAESAESSPEHDYSSSDDSMNGYSDMFPRARSGAQVQSSVPGQAGLRGRLEGSNKLLAQSGASKNNRKGEAWEDVLQKRRAAKAFARFLDQTRGQLVANRLYIPEQDGLRVPLWKRRGFAQLESIILTPRKGASHLADGLKPPGHVLPDAAGKTSGTEKSPAVAASPIWQRRAVGPPTPLSMARRRAPQQLHVPLQKRMKPQMPAVRAH